MQSINADLVRDLLDRFFNAHDATTAAEFFTDDFEFEAGSLGTISGRDVYAKGLTAFWSGLPDAHATAHDIVSILAQIGDYTPPWQR
jgi:hypothetical protein